jgi:hypothetical protein
MKNFISIAIALAAALGAAHAGYSHAAASAEEAKQLGTTLTLFGAEKAGNKEGTIPEYTGGLTPRRPVSSASRAGNCVRIRSRRTSRCIRSTRRTWTNTRTS